jgi:hypothetical protein
MHAPALAGTDDLFRNDGNAKCHPAFVFAPQLTK